MDVCITRRGESIFETILVVSNSLLVNTVVVVVVVSYIEWTIHPVGLHVVSFVVAPVREQHRAGLSVCHYLLPTTSRTDHYTLFSSQCRRPRCWLSES